MTVAETLPPRERDRGSLILLEAPPDDDPLNALTPSTDTLNERAVLGALMHPRNTEALHDVTTTLNPGDFVSVSHEAIYAAVLALYARGRPVDPLTVSEHIGPDLRRHGGDAYLHQLVAGVATTASAGYHATLVAKAAAKRRLVQAGQRIQALGTGPTTIDTDVTDLLDAAGNELAALPRGVPGVEETADYLDFADLYSKPRQPIAWHIAPVLAAGRVTLLFSPGKAGKSLIAMEAACALATGRPALLTTAAGDPQHVLYVDQEMTPDDWQERTSEMGYGIADAPLLNQYLHVANLLSWPPLDTAAGAAELMRRVRDTHARAVVIDTASKVTSGEENSNDTQQAFYRQSLVPLKKQGIAVLVLDHTGKDLERGARGGSAKTDNIDLALQLTVRAADRLTLTPTHVRFRDPAVDSPLLLRRNSAPTLHHAQDDWQPGTASADDTEMRPTHLMERISRYVEANPGCDKQTVLEVVKGRAEWKRKALAFLISEGYVEDARGLHNKAILRELRPFREAGQPGPDDSEEDSWAGHR